ncbi:RNA polymerase III RPC4 domain containing protein [Elaphomyces granulatus]
MPSKGAPRRAAPRGSRGPRPQGSRPQESQPTLSNTSSPVIDPALKNEATPSATSTAGFSISPPRPPVQRLQSLNKRTPSGSIVPRSSLASDDPNQAKPGLKFQPRPVERRSKEKRDEIQRLEEERNQERLAEAAAIQRGRASSRPGGRGGLGRGRGGLLNTGASGPLGSGAAGSVAARSRGAGRRLGSDFGASSTSRHSGTKSTGAKGHRTANVSSDESDSGIRVSIDQINIDSDQDLETPIKKKDKGKKPVRRLTTRQNGLRPIRVERHEHEERAIGIHTEPGSSTLAEERRETKEQAPVDNLSVEESVGLQSEEQALRVKREPVEDGVPMSDLAPQTEESLTVPDPLKPRADKSVGIRDPSNLLRTREENEEFERQAYDRKMLKDLLCVDEAPQSQPRDETAIEDQDAGDPEGAAKEEASDDKRSGQLFLIQFPPLIPNLLVAGAKHEADEANVSDQQDRNADDDVNIIGSNLQQGPVFKQEEDGPDVTEVSPNSSSQQQAAKLVTATQRQLPAGRVGQLNLHESGRVTLDWGGISFELDMATEVKFLQEAVVTSSSPSTAAATETSLAVDEDTTPPEEKKVWAMGQLSGRFVVMPNWDKLL